MSQRIRIVPLDRKLSENEIRTLRQILDSVPPVSGCKGLCHDSCTNVPLSPLEAYFILEKYGGEVSAARPRLRTLRSGWWLQLSGRSSPGAGS